MNDFQYENIKKQKSFANPLAPREFDEKVFEQILSDLYDCYLVLRDKTSDYNYDLETLKNTKASKTKNRFKIELNLIAITLSLSLMIGIPVYGTIKINDARKKNTTVPQTTYTYEAGKLPEITKERVRMEDAEEKKYIVLVEPYNELNYRNITTYDISDIDMPSALDYYTLDLSKIENKTESIEYKEDYSDIGSSEETRRLIIKNVDFNDEQKPGYIWVLLFYIAYIILRIAIDGACGYYSEKFTFFPVITDLVKKLKKRINELSKIKDNEKELKIALKGAINDINSVLSKSEELSRKWNEEFKRNKDLMSDPSLLLSKYDELMKEIKENTMKLKM